MTLLPFLNAPLQIQVHMVTAIIALLLGPCVLYRTRRDRVHKALGYIWIATMALVALSSFAISSNFTSFGLGPLHLLSAFTLWSLWGGLRHARRGDTSAHQATFRSLYTYGLLIAGAFTFMPGRTLNRMLFETTPDLGWLVIAVLLTLVVMRLLRPHLKMRAET